MKMPERRRGFVCFKCGSHECLQGHEKDDTPPCAKCGYLGFARDLDYSEEQMKQYGRDLLEEAAKACEQEPAGLWSADALGNPCDMYIPRWRAVATIRKLKEAL